MSLEQQEGGPQTQFLQDILRQPSEMRRAIEFLTGPGKDALRAAQSLIESSRGVVLTGIGASWHGVMSASTFFDLAARPVVIQDAGELLHFTSMPWKVVVAISRTGRSVEIVKLLAKAKASGAAVIGITNCAESPLSKESDVAIVVPTALDHGISVATFSTLRMAACALTSSSEMSLASVAKPLTRTLEEAEQRLDLWAQQLDRSRWLEPGEPYYFLARGASLGSCHEARLLWEEGVKAPATAMSTSSFRHGPQEIVRPGMRFCLWIDQMHMRDQDLSVAHDLRELGASVMVIGENVSPDDGDLVCELPASPPHWQFAIDILPIQLAAERLSKLSGVDCDSFRICSYVVEDEHGLLHREAEVMPDVD
jgi:glucosamine--fructose-6-phosphate aminotransferase (isomerizing)